MLCVLGVFNVLSAAVQVDSVNVKLGMSQLFSSKMGGNGLSVGRIDSLWDDAFYPDIEPAPIGQ